MLEPEVFQKQMICIEQSTCDIVGTFRGPHSNLAPGELCPPRYAPGRNVEEYLLHFLINNPAFFWNFG